MTTRILVAIDGSTEAMEALQFTAEEWPTAAVTALYVINPAESTAGADGGFPGSVERWYESAQARGERILADAAKQVDRDINTQMSVGRPTTTILAVADGTDGSVDGGSADGESAGDGSAGDGSAGDGSVDGGSADGESVDGESADTKGFDHLVLASHGRTGLSRVLLGSVAEGVVRRATIPVTVVR